MALLVGGATRVINCEIGDDLCGQMHRRFCRRIRDSLEANVLYLANADQAVLLVSLDLVGLFAAEWIRTATSRIETETGIPARDIIITSTHTHAGPDTFGLLHDSPRNEAYLARLVDWLVEAASEAKGNARPAQVGWGLGHAHIGYNRRLCWQDGTHTMYGDSSRAEFTGIEGPDDPAHAVLFAEDADGKLIGLVHNNCCHATCLESEDYASADFPGEARRQIRQALDTDLPVLYLQGASGDTSPWDMMRPNGRYPSSQRLAEMGMCLANETLRLVRQAERVTDPVLRHTYEDVPVGLRMPTPDEVAHAESIEALGEEKAVRWEYVFSVAGILRLWRELKDVPTQPLAVHAVRVGDLAIATNPCELYCQFGLDTKRRSPAGVTMVSQLTDGFAGYCPTLYGVIGGGYSGQAIYWTRLEERAGYKLVDAATRLTHGLWQD